ncbi:MAG: DUF3899 domain-containing protein [Clostridium sp.]|jgi:hypothetical protein|nr:DUF3899 domain-containing protein [Clostridium sp.]
MTNRQSKPYTKYIVSATVGILITLAVAWMQGAFSTKSTADLMRIFSNGTLTAGVLLAGVGLLTASSTAGTFDMLAYGVRSLVASFRRDRSKRDQPKDFYEYRTAKDATRKTSWYLVFVGGVYLLTAIILTICYYHA